MVLVLYCEGYFDSIACVNEFKAACKIIPEPNAPDKAVVAVMVQVSTTTHTEHLVHQFRLRDFVTLP